MADIRQRLDTHYISALTAGGYQPLRHMNEEELSMAIRHYQEDYPNLSAFLIRVRTKLRKYRRLYGATVVADMPIFAFEQACLATVQRPVANVK